MGNLDRQPLSQELPEVVVTPTTTDIFCFSAVTWNRHKIHFDKEAAQAEGHADVVVQRALLGNYFALLLDRWLGQHGDVRKLSWKVLSSALPGKPLRCLGQASMEGSNVAHCEMSIIDETGNVVATGKAECALKLGVQS